MVGWRVPRAKSSRGGFRSRRSDGHRQPIWTGRTAERGAIIKAMRSAADVSGSWSETPRRASRRGLGTAALVFLAVVLLLGLLGLSLGEGLLSWDVRFAYLPAAEDRKSTRLNSS